MWMCREERAWAGIAGCIPSLLSSFFSFSSFIFIPPSGGHLRLHNQDPRSHPHHIIAVSSTRTYSTFSMPASTTRRTPVYVNVYDMIASNTLTSIGYFLGLGMAHSPLLLYCC
ncbi:hypothetical protein EDD21DRAFT_99487 [Dissophora ornata]|nr:hypothetical protein EDD21DRAFT_99487 [Dissophora ornata]